MIAVANIFVAGVLVGLLVGLAVAFMVLGRTVHIQIDGVDDITIRGGINLVPETGGINLVPDGGGTPLPLVPGR